VAGTGEVQLEVDGGVAVVTLNAPDRRNALTPAMADELIATFDEVDGRADVGALVIRAVGKSFCAGGDIATLTSAGEDPAAPESYAGMGKIYDSFYRLGQVRVPTIAAVRGSAVGAGMNMLLAADLRIVATDARLICGFLKRGLHPGGGHFVILSRLIGREAAAASRPISRERMTKCPPPGCSPRLRKPQISRASRAMIRRSAASSMFMPAPTAEPRTAATVGTLTCPSR